MTSTPRSPAPSRHRSSAYRSLTWRPDSGRETGQCRRRSTEFSPTVSPTSFLTHSPEAETNLQVEGIDVSRVRYVGNTMIDSLRRFEAKARAQAVWQSHGVEQGEYVSSPSTGRRTSMSRTGSPRSSRHSSPSALGRRSSSRCIRARGRACQTPTCSPRLEAAGVRCIDPVGYLDFLSLQAGAGAVVTDSGGVQEETALASTRCYTLRANTERPVTISHGTNALLGDAPDALLDVRLSGQPPTPCAIPLWDGHRGAARRRRADRGVPGIVARDLAALA